MDKDKIDPVTGQRIYREYRLNVNGQIIYRSRDHKEVYEMFFNICCALEKEEIPVSLSCITVRANEY
jgi:hypothetical protein